MSDLASPIYGDGISAIPLIEAHGDALRAACAEDRDIWQLYFSDFGPGGFDASFDGLLARTTPTFALFDGDRLVGMSSYLNIDEEPQTLEIGTTYLRPDVRGTGLNRRIKDLMIRRALECGYPRILFRVDVRNQRSQAAVRKLGALPYRIDVRDRTTWTGHVRDTALFLLDARTWRL